MIWIMEAGMRARGILLGFAAIAAISAASLPAVSGEYGMVYYYNGGTDLFSSTVQNCMKTPYGGIKTTYYDTTEFTRIPLTTPADVPFTERRLGRTWLPAGTTTRAEMCGYSYNVSGDGWAGHGAVSFPKCDYITTTTLCDIQTDSYDVRQCQTEAHLIKSKLAQNQGLMWVDHVVSDNQPHEPFYLPRLFTCHTNETPEPITETEKSNTDINVVIEKPRLPQYQREGGTLKKSFDDFVGPR